MRKHRSPPIRQTALWGKFALQTRPANETSGVYPTIVPFPRASLLCSIITVSYLSASSRVNSAFSNPFCVSACARLKASLAIFFDDFESLNGAFSSVASSLVKAKSPSKLRCFRQALGLRASRIRAKTPKRAGKSLGNCWEIPVLQSRKLETGANFSEWWVGSGLTRCLAMASIFECPASGQKLTLCGRSAAPAIDPLLKCAGRDF